MQAPRDQDDEDDADVRAVDHPAETQPQALGETYLGHAAAVPPPKSTMTSIYTPPDLPFCPGDVINAFHLLLALPKSH